MALRALYDVAAPAKLNLFLHVVGRRPDGYHLLQSVVVPIDWCDTLHFERRDDRHLARHDLGDPLPADDLCLRAARGLQTASGTQFGVDLSIEKRVPSGAGMGGGSSDAASTLLALNRLWDLHWTCDQLRPLALALGADVPFFLGSGPALVEGIGERLTPVTVDPGWFAVLKPVTGLETRAIFQSPTLTRSCEIDSAAILEGFAEGQRGSPRAAENKAALDDAGCGTDERGGPLVVSGSLGPGESSGPSGPVGRNDLQAAAEGLCPEVKAAAGWLQARFGNSRMTGSGSAVFACAGTGDHPRQRLPEHLPNGWTGRMCRSLASHPLAGWAD